jgi:phosphopantetheine adenylyltransferase
MTTTNEQQPMEKALELIQDYKKLVQDLKELIAAHKAQIAVYDNLTNHWVKSLQENRIEEVIASMNKVIELKNND